MTRSSTSESAVDENAEVVLFKDREYGVQFTTQYRCRDYYRMDLGEMYPTSSGVSSFRTYTVTIPESESWPTGEWYNFYVYASDQYNTWDLEKDPLRPAELFALDSGRVLTWRHPQEGPSDGPGCGVTPEKL